MLNEYDSPVRLLRRLPLLSLQIFEAAGRTTSFAKAALELDLSPSAVSHSIRKLETIAGLQLFIRSTRQVSLTAEGLALLRQVQKGFDEMSHGFSLAKAAGPTPLRIHCAPSFAAQWLIPRLPGFLDENPAFEIRIHANTDYASFDDNDFDVDIVYGEPSAHQCEITPLVIEKLQPMCSPKLASRITSEQDLYDQVLIQSDGQSVQWKGWFETNNMRCSDQYGLGFDRSSMAISAAAAGLGVVLESDLLAQGELASGKLVMPLEGISRPIRYVGHYLVKPRRQLQNHALEQFSAWLLRELAAH